MWTTIGNDIIQFVQTFLFFDEFPTSVNTTLVSLISKIPNPLRIEDFRPISIVGSLYKIVPKVIASRLKLVIGDVISDT